MIFHCVCVKMHSINKSIADNKAKKTDFNLKFTS